MDAELKSLMDQFRKVQEASASANRKLNDRNTVEIIGHLCRRQGLELIYTTDGREVLTPAQLEREILDEVDVQGGRVNVCDLPGLLCVDISHVERALPRLVSSPSAASSVTTTGGTPGTVQLIDGELMSPRFLASTLEDVLSELELRGTVSVTDIARSARLTSTHVAALMAGWMQTGRLRGAQFFEDDQSTIFTADYLASTQRQVLAILSAISRPTDLSRLATRLAKEIAITATSSAPPNSGPPPPPRGSGGSGVSTATTTTTTTATATTATRSPLVPSPEKMVQMAAQLCQFGMAPGRLDGCMYTPYVFEAARDDMIVHAYQSNAILPYKFVQTQAGVSAPKTFLASRYGLGPPTGAATPTTTTATSSSAKSRGSASKGGKGSSGTAKPTSTLETPSPEELPATARRPAPRLTGHLLQTVLLADSVVDHLVSVLGTCMRAVGEVDPSANGGDMTSLPSGGASDGAPSPSSPGKHRLCVIDLTRPFRSEASTVDASRQMAAAAKSSQLRKTPSGGGSSDGVGGRQPSDGSDEGQDEYDTSGAASALLLPEAVTEADVEVLFETIVIPRTASMRQDGAGGGGGPEVMLLGSRFVVHLRRLWQYVSPMILTLLEEATIAGKKLGGTSTAADSTTVDKKSSKHGTAAGGGGKGGAGGGKKGAAASRTAPGGRREDNEDDDGGDIIDADGSPRTPWHVATSGLSTLAVTGVATKVELVTAKALLLSGNTDAASAAVLAPRVLRQLSGRIAELLEQTRLHAQAQGSVEEKKSQVDRQTRVLDAVSLLRQYAQGIAWIATEPSLSAGGDLPAALHKQLLTTAALDVTRQLVLDVLPPELAAKFTGYGKSSGCAAPSASTGIDTAHPKDIVSELVPKPQLPNFQPILEALSLSRKIDDFLKSLEELWGGNIISIPIRPVNKKTDREATRTALLKFVADEKTALRSVLSIGADATSKSATTMTLQQLASVAYPRLLIAVMARCFAIVLPPTFPPKYFHGLVTYVASCSRSSEDASLAVSAGGEAAPNPPSGLDALLPPARVAALLGTAHAAATAAVAAMRADGAGGHDASTPADPAASGGALHRALCDVFTAAF